MNVKNLYPDALCLISRYLDDEALLSFFIALNDTNCTRKLFYHKPQWFDRCKRLGIFNEGMKQIDTAKIKQQVVEHMQSVYRDVRKICSLNTAQSVAKILREDNAEQLELHLRQTSHYNATLLMPLAIRFARTAIMHSLFNHFNVNQSYHYLLLAIRMEQYAAVKYLVEIKKISPVTWQAGILLPSSNHLWDKTYPWRHTRRHNNAGSYCHVNELILREIIRCKHPKIVRYLSEQLNITLEKHNAKHPSETLFKKLRRHSLEGVPMKEYCPSPDLSKFRKG